MRRTAGAKREWKPFEAMTKEQRQVAALTES
jgi:hypothetical protein